MACASNCINEDFDCNDCVKLDEIVARLAAYEDTNLTPEEIMILCSMDRRAKMAELLRMEENKPLTLAELRKMDGEPVWDSALSQYGLVDIRLFNGKGCIRYFDNWTNPRCLVPDRYYRRRPEEGTI